VRRVRRAVGPDGALVLGVDRRKDPCALHAAYSFWCRPTTRTVNPREDETRIEAYYRWHFLDNFHLSPFVQFVDNRSGTQTDSDFWLFGARLHLSF